MRLPRGLLLLVCCLASLAAPSVIAIESQSSASGLQSLVTEARDLLHVTQGQLRDLEYAMANMSDRDSSRLFSSSAEYRDVQRSASQLAEIANKVVNLTAQCGEDTKRVGADFKGSTRRFSSTVSRIASSSGATFAQMSVGDLQRDLQGVGEKLRVVAGVTDCSPDSDDDPDDETASKGE